MMDNKQKVIENQLSKGGLRGRINAMCASCIYDPGCGGGSWRKQVTDCTSKGCPLYDVRPQESAKTVDLSAQTADIS